MIANAPVSAYLQKQKSYIVSKHFIKLFSFRNLQKQKSYIVSKLKNLAVDEGDLQKQKSYIVSKQIK